MIKPRYKIVKNWLFYLFVIGYAYFVLNMTFQLWFGSGINIFATYSEATIAAEMIVDANKVYWSKTTFLFLTLVLYAFNLDYRFAVGIGATFWSFSLILMFGLASILIMNALLGPLLILQQIWRKQIFRSQDPEAFHQIKAVR
ncbi:MAG: hypothetical protein AAF614_32135 [Chloroflexota bacterium]